MKRRVKVLVSVVALLMILITGCDGSNEVVEHQVSLVVVAGVHSNSYQVPFSASTITEQLRRVSTATGQVTFINCDGNPSVFYNAEIKGPEIQGLSDEKLARDAADYVVQLQNALMQATAFVSEVDTLKAIRTGSQALESTSNNNVDKVLLILDSGLSTDGYVDFTSGLLNAEPEDVVEALNEVEAIPDLSGIDVIWSFIGVTAPPQEELSESDKNSLKEIWRAILLEAGANSITFKNDFMTTDVNCDLPDVTVVDADEDLIDVEISVEDEEVQIVVETVESVILDSESVCFLGDSAQFKDEDAATSAVSEVANQLIAYPENKVYVIGTAASGRDEYCLELSRARATAVMELLISLGVPEMQMEVVGLGDNDPWHIDDLDENGRQIEHLATQNRKVLILDVNSEEATFLEN